MAALRGGVGSWAILVGSLVPVAAGAGDPEDLEGTWRVVELRGKPDPGGHPNFVFSDGRVKGLVLQLPGGKKTVDAPYEVDTTNDPAHLTIKLPIEIDGVSGIEMLCIYRIRGDRLEICQGPQRPTEFEAKPGSDRVLWVCKRQARAR
jgi:uncharacterized protein (TIGR03067 family)